MNFIESYESPDGKKRCRFVSARRRFVSLDSSVAILPSQQDDTIGRVGDASLHLSTINILIMCLQIYPHLPLVLQPCVATRFCDFN